MVSVEVVHHLVVLTVVWSCVVAVTFNGIISRFLSNYQIMAESTWVKFSARLTTNLDIILIVLTD